MIQPAHSRARILAVVAIALGATVAMFALILLKRWLVGLEVSGSRKDLEQLLLVLGATLGVGVCGVFGLGLFCFRFGRQVCREARFPPANTRIVKETVVHTGANAVHRGRWAQALGVTFISFALVLAFLGARVIGFFIAHAG